MFVTLKARMPISRTFCARGLDLTQYLIGIRTQR